MEPKAEIIVEWVRAASRERSAESFVRQSWEVRVVPGVAVASRRERVVGGKAGVVASVGHWGRGVRVERVRNAVVVQGGRRCVSEGLYIVQVRIRVQREVERCRWWAERANGQVVVVVELGGGFAQSSFRDSVGGV